ncbi:hypothetical protein BX616_010396 [Lobosporangium transversale]|nr:hypothetical protein BX616_010396 [Lobosporangium transversale]
MPTLSSAQKYPQITGPNFIISLESLRDERSSTVSLDPAASIHNLVQKALSFQSSLVPTMVSQASDLPFPSVQELSLMLSADIEIHRLWKTITEILSQKFYATRITLSLPQDPTAVASSIENNLHQSRPWGLKAHWDYKHHFLDENTVTPKDEFAHHHHRLQKNSSLAQDYHDLQSLRLSVSSFPLPSSSSSSSFSSSSSPSSFSRRRATTANNSFNININGNDHSREYDHINTNSIDENSTNRGSAKSDNGDTNNTRSRQYYPVPDTVEYHEDYWTTNPPQDCGYSSSTSSASSYSSVSDWTDTSRSAIRPRRFTPHSSGTECFANLQSLEYDPEPLLNERTIDSILKAGKTVVLTREYVGSKTMRRKGSRMRSFLSRRVHDEEDDSSYTDTDPADDHADIQDVEDTDRKGMARALYTEGESIFEQDTGSDMDSSSSRYDSEGSYFPPVETTLYNARGNNAGLLGGHSKTGYTDIVQGLNPTWSQSPAPSPNIIKEDPTINPFFQPLTSYPAMDEDTFDPPDSISDSTEDDHNIESDQPKESYHHTGPSRPQVPVSSSQIPLPTPSSVLSNARSLIHIPLYRSMDHNNQRYLPSDIRSHRPPAMPVGIISFLSDQIPYPPEALDILTDLNPFLANQITNALRLEDIVTRSHRWGDISTPSMSDGPLTNETFAESIQRKMKETGDDLRTPKPSTVSHSASQDYMNATSAGISHPRHKQSSTRYTTAASRIRSKSRNQQSNASQTLSKQLRMTKDPEGYNDSSSYKYQSSTQAKMSIKRDTTVPLGPSGLSDGNLTEPEPSPVHSPNENQFDPYDMPQSSKQPEACYNLDSTTDEIHRNLNLLNLDVTGSATCPLAPQTKKVSGRQHHTSRNALSHHTDDAFLSGWSNDCRRMGSSKLLDIEGNEGLDNHERMWQTLQAEEPEERARSLPSSRLGDSELELAGNESLRLSSTHSVSPTGGAKRHLFSTSKRSGLRRRRKSVKDHIRSRGTPSHLSESPLPSSPYTPTMSGFSSQQSEASSGSANISVPAFSPDPSPIASPSVHQTRAFDHDFRMMDLAASHEHGEARKTSLSRQGSGWSFNSDDTSLTSPGPQHEKHHVGRKHKRKHHAFSSERHGHNPFPRTRLLRLIVDAISHHVFTLSPRSGCLTWLNQRSLQYTGLPLSQLLHTSWTQLLHEDDRETFQPLFKDCFIRGEMFNAQYRVRRFDGQYRWFLGRILPVRDCGGNIVHWFGTCTDIHDQKLVELQFNRQVELELSEKKYRLLAEAIPQIVFTASPHIGLTYANAKWFTYSGQVFEQASGLGFMDHVHPDDRAKCFLPTNLPEGSGPPPEMSGSDPSSRYSTSPGTAYGKGPGEVSYQTEMRLLRKDSKYRWFLVKCISVEVVEQGRKWFGTCTDINDQKLLEHKLKEAHDAAQKSTESKTRFLSNMSHDLTSEQLDYVHTVQQSAEALLLVINDILDLSKVEAGMMKLEMEPFSVHAMIEGANELLSTLAIQKGLELGFLVEDDVPEVVVGDRVRLRQVLINIIGNAIKFTSQGEVFSRCSLVPSKPNTDPTSLTIKFEISDTGKGFDESERAVMFKPFSQVDTSSTRKHGGTGLGLVLSKEFVELHGGSIQCESVKGQGSKFSFTFVARIPPPNTTARATTPIASDDVHLSEMLKVNRKPTPSASAASSAVPVLKLPSKSTSFKDNKAVPEILPLRHVTGLKLIPGEMCFAEPDLEDTIATASNALKSAARKIGRGEFATADITLNSIAEDELEARKHSAALNPKANIDLPVSDISTVMSRTESILDERRYLKVGQLTPTNPPLGEPPSVAIVAANLPNPAVDMKLAIPAKVLESKALAAETKKTVTPSAAVSQLMRPVQMLSNNSSSSASSSSVSSSSSLSSSSSSSTISSFDSKLSASTAISSSESLTLPVSTPISPEQPRILVIADLLHARETILHLVNQLVPKELNPLIDVAVDLKEGIEYLVGERKQVTLTGKFNYLLINLASYMAVMDIFSAMQQDGVLVESNIMTCVITTPMQRAALMEAIKVEEASMEIVKPKDGQTPIKVIPDKVEWVFKPLTKARLYVAFADAVMQHDCVSGDHSGSRTNGKDGFVDSNKINLKRRTAQQVVINQKEIFNQMHDAMEGRNIRILLAEDDLTNQKVIRRYFQKVGAELVIANDGNECVDKFKSYPRNHFSLILCDLFMPGKDGYEATRTIRDWESQHLQEGEKRIPIVALSANVMANVAEQCLNSGFTSYLSKPVDFKKLSETLCKLVL